jgi:Reverse transcriptase (RNA-dependent DNA polymerase)
VNTWKRGKGEGKSASSRIAHYAGRIIDHLFFPKDAPPERTFVIVIPPKTKDHAIIIGGTTRKSWATTETPKSIPDFYASDPNFIEEVMTEVGKIIPSEGRVLLAKIKASAWNVFKEWRDKDRKEADIKRLCGLKLALKHYLKMRWILKDGLTVEEVEILSLARVNTKSLKPKTWQTKIVGPCISVARKLIQKTECWLGIRQGFKFGKLRKDRRTKPIMRLCVEDEEEEINSKGEKVKKYHTVKRRKKMQKELKNFWEGLFDQVRPYNEKVLEEMANQHPQKFKEEAPHVVDRKLVLKLLKRGNSSCPGPNGIPFVFFKLTADVLLDMWVEIIKQAGMECDFGGDFVERQLCLIPKVKGFPKPSEFRPITITNSDYRIITRYWAKWFAVKCEELIAPEQKALLAGRSIDDAVELVHDDFLERLVQARDVTLFQSDFFKAFNSINREVLRKLLVLWKAPPQIINLVDKIMVPTRVSMPSLGMQGEDNDIIISRT